MELPRPLGYDFGDLQGALLCLERTLILARMALDDDWHYLCQVRGWPSAQAYLFLREMDEAAK